MANAKPATFAVLLEKFFSDRLIKQRDVSPHTIKSYRDSFCLLLHFVQMKIGRLPSKVDLSLIDAPLIASFLEHLENERKVSARSRNLRLTAIRSFFRFAALEAPANAGQIQRILALPAKRHERAMVTFLTKEEIKTLLAAPDQSTWSGRRDHALILLAVHTGLRLSELTRLCRQDVMLGTGAHVRVMGKGRKERCTPLTKQTVAVLRAWLQEPVRNGTGSLFPNSRGGVLSADGIQYILTKHSKSASRDSPSLGRKRVTAHCLRHTAAMELLQAGIDRSMIALWLGHESVETTQVYLHANLALQEKLLEQTSMIEGCAGRYHPDDQLLAFLKNL